MRGWLVISLFVVILAASACSDQLACSAYQSYFILDNVNYPRNGYPKDRAQGLAANRFDYPDLSYHERENPIRNEYYAYLDVDSFPKENRAAKDQFGIVKKQPLRAKERALQTIPMQVVIPEAPDSLLFAGDEELFAELDLVDSAAIDSVRSLGRSYQYNLDQKYYLWYLRNKLVWKDEVGEEGEETSATDTEAAAVDSEASVEDNMGFIDKVKAFFQNLFKKKEPELDPAVDEAPTEEAPAEDNGDGF
jgi:hypothetical protein